MGSRRFCAHAHNHLGDVKGSGHYQNFGGNWDYWKGALELLILLLLLLTCLFKLRPGVLSKTLSHM